MPSVRAMIALERVARLGSVTRAAEELNTSQAAVSRHLRQLEVGLGVALVTRSGRGIVLTPVGRGYAQDISEVLSKMRLAGERAAANSHELTIACTHEVSHLILMPHYAALKRALGRNVHIRIVTCEYTAIPAMIDAGADIVFEYRRTHPQSLAAPITAEEIVPVGSPEMIAENKGKLGKSPDTWHGIPRLSLTKANSGWATWDHWFAFQGVSAPDAPEQMFDNYVYALEAATRGEGLVLGWRGFADRYLKAGDLVPAHSNWVKCGPTLYAVSTPNGSLKPLTRKCIKALSASVIQ